MPYIRFTRDRRGYEHTCVMHAGRRHGKKQERLLYWFRTPPNVKVGRSPIDEEAVRKIEQENPDLTFDWPRMLEARPPAPSEPAVGRNRRWREGETGGRGVGAPRSGRGGARPSGARREPVLPAGPPAGVVAPPPEPPPAPEETVEAAPVELPELSGRAADETSVALDVPESARPVPVEEIVGAEGLARLRTRYAEVQARITERGGEPARVEQLRKEADALNPDAWVTLDDARRALEQFETVFEGLRRAIGRRRRSRRGGARRSRRRRAAAGAVVGTESDASSGQAEAAPANEVAGEPASASDAFDGDDDGADDAPDDLE